MSATSFTTKTKKLLTQRNDINRRETKYVYHTVELYIQFYMHHFMIRIYNINSTKKTKIFTIALTKYTSE